MVPCLDQHWSGDAPDGAVSKGWSSGMTGFDDRKKAAESKFAHDSEKEFRAQARRLLAIIKAGHA